MLKVADNTGAKRASMICVLGRKGSPIAHVGDIINCNIKESSPDAAIKKGEKAQAVVVRSRAPIRRPDGSLFAVYLAFYSVWRIGSDFLREGSPFVFGLHQAQFIGIVVLIFSLVWMAWRTRWVKKGEGPVYEPPSSPGAGQSA